MSEREVDPQLDDDSLDGVERELLQGPGARLQSDAAPIDRAAAKQVVQRFRRHERQRRSLLGGGAVLSLAAAAALVVGLRQRAPQAQTQLASQALSPLVLEVGRVVLSGAPQLRLGEPVAAGQSATLAAGTCLRAGSNVRLCAKSASTLRLPALGRSWDVELESGAITADLAAMPAGFAVRTRHGSASVVGTLFSMELDPSGAFTTVSVERGSVRCRNTQSGEEALLWLGQQARLGERLLVTGGAPQQPAAVEPSAQPAPAASEPSPGAHRAGSGSAGAAEQVSPGDLLEIARQERGARHYSEAARSYRKLVQLHPSSPEARAALVSLGQLELGQLGQPEAALRSFQAYLAHPGQLRQEAEHGAIQALQKLGRSAEERRAIEAFLARYPKSTQAGPLSQRLKQL